MAGIRSEAVLSLLDKIAIVTGGGSGIGEAVSHELARRGAAVVVADINSGDAARVAEAIVRRGGRAEARQVDVSSEDAVRQLVGETAARHGRLDYLFNNAGIGIGGDARDLTSEHWRQVLGVDLFGVIYGTLAAYPIMTRQGFGHIVNTSSAAGLLPGPFNAPYNTSKHAVVGLSLSLRMEAADLGVKVSVVCPGFVRTSIYQTAVTVNIPQDKASATARLPSRMMEPPRAAQVILDGVEKNQAVIVFPASIRWVWRAYRITPGLLSRLLTPLLLRRIRELRSYRLTSDEATEAAEGRGCNRRRMARRAELNDVIPVLPARDVSEAVQFYVERLGFELLFQDTGDRPQYAGIRRGAVELHLQFQFEKDFEAGTAGQAMLRLAVDDPDVLFEEYADKDVFHEGTQLRDTSWGTREFAFWDLNHNGLTFMRNL